MLRYSLGFPATWSSPQFRLAWKWSWLMSRYSFVAVCLCMPFGIAVIGSFASMGSCPVRAESLPATAHWAQWRGPSGQGYSDDTRVPLVWSDTNNLLWKTPLPGRGNSSPIMWGDRIFLTAASSNGDERYVLCVRAEDGKLLWKQVSAQGVEPGRTHAWNGYASASCATDGTHVYAFFGTPGLFCYDFDGRLVWKHSFGIFTADTGWGCAASPFLVDDLVIQNCDNDGPAALPKGHAAAEAAPMALVALDKATGEVRWQTRRDQGKGWSTPLLIPMPDGRIDLVLNGPYGVWAYDPRTGAERWHCERQKGNEQALFGEPLPAFTGDILYAASGRPGPLQAIRLGNTGDVSKSNLLWEVNRPRGSRDVASPILWGDYLFIGDRQPQLSCYDRQTGKLLYKERIGNRPLCASPVAVQGKLLFLIEDGTTLVVEPGSQFKVNARNKLSDATEFRASPAIVDGRLFLRSQSQLYCIGEKK
jgi:outer membrane protein assembly factor BamB